MPRFDKAEGIERKGRASTYDGNDVLFYLIRWDFAVVLQEMAGYGINVVGRLVVPALLQHIEAGLCVCLGKRNRAACIG